MNTAICSLRSRRPWLGGAPPGCSGAAIAGETGFDFDIAIHLGAGAYVCGEESALIESLEGKRGIPRNRPPYPVTHGYLQQPTVVNNVETLCAAALIALKGGDWYRAVGTARSAGTKLLSVAGDCARPGIYEYPFGVTVRQVLADCGAARAQAVQISGPSGVCVAAGEFDRRIGFEDLATAGAFMIFDESRDMFEVARNYVHFFAHESCGFCTPCRVGTTAAPQHHGQAARRARARSTTSTGSDGSTSCCSRRATAASGTRPAIRCSIPSSASGRPMSSGCNRAISRPRSTSMARWQGRGTMTGRDDAGAHLGPE